MRARDERPAAARGIGRAWWAIRGFLWLAALAPFLAHRLPIFHQQAGVIAWPLFAHLGGEDLFWIGLALLDGAVLLSGRRARGWVFAALPVVALLLLVPDRPLDRRFAELRDRPRAEGERILFTPVGFAPDEADFVLMKSSSLPPPAPPSPRHWLGTDSSGRDLLARLLYGTRVSLGVGTAAAAVALAIGLLVGLACGTLRGWVDLVLMRVVEIVLCFPGLFLVLIVFAYLPRRQTTLVLLLGLVGWTTVARLLRAELNRLQGQEFILAARALGVSRVRLAWRHLLPNALAPVLVAASFGVSGAVLAEFSLSFLGFGVAAPTPSLGQILAEGRRFLERAPWMVVLPGVMIFLVVMSFNALGDALRVANERGRGPGEPTRRGRPAGGGAA